METDDECGGRERKAFPGRRNPQNLTQLCHVGSVTVFASHVRYNAVL